MENKVKTDLMMENVPTDCTFPIRCDFATLSQYEERRFSRHWHPELQFTVILDGAIKYLVNDSSYHLEAGSGIFVNRYCLHEGLPYQDMDCSYMGISFDPVLIYGYKNSAIESSYVAPLIDFHDLASFYLDPQNENIRRLIGLLQDINTLLIEKPICYQLKISSGLCELWSIFFQEFQKAANIKDITYSKNIARIKNALEYIEQHYSDRVMLAELASTCNVSISEFCRLFKRAMRRTPIEYLLYYRIQKSIPLLINKDLGITQISESVGFDSASYYSEIFRRYLRCSPSEYRKEFRLHM